LKLLQILYLDDLDLKLYNQDLARAMPTSMLGRGSPDVSQSNPEQFENCAYYCPLVLLQRNNTVVHNNCSPLTVIIYKPFQRVLLFHQSALHVRICSHHHVDNQLHSSCEMRHMAKSHGGTCNLDILNIGRFYCKNDTKLVS